MVCCSNAAASRHIFSPASMHALSYYMRGRARIFCGKLSRMKALRHLLAKSSAAFCHRVRLRER
jgi:hypothetical protein